MDELGIPDTIHDYAFVVSSVADELFDSESFTDGDIADQITLSVFDKVFCIDVKDDGRQLGRTTIMYT